jgi:hypothetical protein
MERMTRMVVAATLFLLTLTTVASAQYTDTIRCLQQTYGSGWCTSNAKYDDSIIRGYFTMQSTKRGWGDFDISKLTDPPVRNYDSVKLFCKEVTGSGNPIAYLTYVPYADPTSNPANRLFDSLSRSLPSAFALGFYSYQIGWNSLKFPAWGSWPDDYPVSNNVMVIAWTTSESGSTDHWAADFGWNTTTHPYNDQPYLLFFHGP